MNGKVFPVAQGRALAEAILSAKTPEEVKELSPWVKNSKEMMGKTPKELAAAGKILPPFHFNCRGTTVAHFGASGEPGTVDTTEKGKQIRLSPERGDDIVEYSTVGRFGDRIYVTEERINHIKDSRRKPANEKRVEHREALHFLDTIPAILADPDEVIIDPQYGENNLIYYKQIPGLKDGKGTPQWLAVVVHKSDCKHVVTMYPSRVGKVKTSTGRKDEKNRLIHTKPVVIYKKGSIEKWLGRFLMFISRAAQ